MVIKEIAKEIKDTDNVVVNILKDMILDFKRVCKKQRIIITMLVLSNIISIIPLIYSILK